MYRAETLSVQICTDGYISPFFSEAIDKHGPNNTHDTEDCKVLTSLAKGENTSKSKNKSWTRDKSKDMAAIIQKCVRKELHALTKSSNGSKKRKATNDLNAIQDMSDDDSIKLEDIDFDKLEGMSFTSESNDDESFHTASNN